MTAWVISYHEPTRLFVRFQIVTKGNTLVSNVPNHCKSWADIRKQEQEKRMVSLKRNTIVRENECLVRKL